MAKNDVILLDGIIEDRINNNRPSNHKDEAFEFLATEQILKEFDLSDDEILSGSVDGRNDGGIDEFFIFVNGHLLADCESFFWPKANAELEVHIITCKHHDTFKQQPLDSLIASLTELLDFGLSEKNLKGDYNSELIEKRSDFIFAFKKLSTILTRFNIKVSYASRGNTELIGDNVAARARQIEAICSNYFSSCIVGFKFWGCQEILNTYRRIRKYGLDLLFQEYLSQGEQYVVLSKIEDYYKFITNDEGKLSKHLFESNVRDYMGLNPVNVDIMKTLNSPKSPNFWWLNNGITILATSASIVGKTIHIENVQIVNGLQTSESIFRYFRERGIDSSARSVLIKIIVENSMEVRDDIIRATNNQTEVGLASLHATDKIQRDIEEILYRENLYYERRINYYSNQGFPKVAIYNPLYLASAYVNMILKQPHKAVTLKNRFMRDTNDYNIVFSENTNLNVWPKLARILRTTDLELEKLRNKNNKNIESFLKTTRQLTSFITISRLIGTYNFNEGDLISFDMSQYTAQEIEITWGTINEYTNGNWQKTLWRKKDSTMKVCEYAANKHGIRDFEAISKRSDPLNLRKKSHQRKHLVFDEEFLTQVNSLLPTPPLKKDIHKSIATELNCSNAKVFQAIRVLIERGIRNQQTV